MPRKKNDGRGRLGGRETGTPNKDNPLKQLLHDHSLDYFTPSVDANTVDFLKDENGQTYIEYRDKMLSRYDLDCLRMKASDRAKLEVEILAYHTPKMQAISADMNVKGANRSITEVLVCLANNEDLPPPQS